jgi:uncharacterized membrane protein YsdA (DUF1294 family)/cold shock CspA family protein
MRFAGRITDWNDDKGFGFVVPNGGGDRAFVHVNEFRRGAKRPVTGDLISYLPVKDAQGRLQAREIRHAGERAPVQRERSRFPRAALGAAALLAVLGAAAAGRIPVFMAGVYLGVGLVSYLLYFFDKMAAERGARRTPENTLHLVDLLGGWAGALIAQQQFRHKTIKQPFQAIFWVTVAANLVVAWWLLHSPVGAEITSGMGWPPGG